MSQQRNQWRRELREYLAERVGVSISVGALFAEFGPRIPLHHASRVWLDNHDEVGDPTTMRWRCFLVMLYGYRLDYEGGGPRRGLCAADTIIPRATPCVICGLPFFLRKLTRTCSAAACRHATYGASRRRSVERRKASRAVDEIESPNP